MSYRRIGLGEDTTYDPPPSAYCTTYINQINALKSELEQAGRNCSTAISSVQAGAAGAAAGCAQGMSAINGKLTAAINEIQRLNGELAAANNKSCPIPEKCSCFWWIVATAVTTSIAVVAVVRKKNPKSAADKVADKALSKKAP